MTVPEYIYAESVNAGLTKEGACALLGNIQEESAFRTNNLEDRANEILNVTDEQYTRMVDDGTWPDFATDNGVHGGYGLIQVTLAKRKRQFLDFMKSRGKSISDLDGQVSFILWEMRSMYPSVWRTVTTSTNLYDCTWKILDVYENPAEKTENMKRRYANAQQWYTRLKDKEVLRSMTQSDAVRMILDLARSEIGYHEKASGNQLDDKTSNSGSGNWTKYAGDLDALTDFYNGAKNGYAWCDIFVDWLFYKLFGAQTAMQMLCQPQRSAGAGCLYSAQYYKQAGRWASQPQPGDQIFFSYSPGEYSHTGIVESVGDGMVNTIEGNTGDQVARRRYPISSGAIVGYGRPKWDVVSGLPADNIKVPKVPESEVGGNSNVQTEGVILRKGSKGEAVQKLQKDLMKLGYDLGSWGADGDFGNDTYKAVVKFQREYKVSPVDGEAGPITLSAIAKALNKKNKNAAATSPTEDDDPPIIGLKFRVGEVVNFIGNGHYFTAGANVGVRAKQGKAMIRAVNTSAAAKHPYRVRAVRGGGSTVNGWVDENALQKI